MSDNDPGDGLSNYERAALNLFAGIEHQVTRIADRLGRPDVHLTHEQVQEAWDAELRMYGDRAEAILGRLGIVVD